MTFRPNTIFVRRGWGWGWMDGPLLTRLVKELDHICVCGGIKSRVHRAHYLRAIAILGQYAHDNACDIEGLPMYTGKMGSLRKAVRMVDEYERRRLPMRIGGAP